MYKNTGIDGENVEMKYFHEDTEIERISIDEASFYILQLLLS